MARSVIECCSFLFFNDTATTEIYTLSLHDALPISELAYAHGSIWRYRLRVRTCALPIRSEEHTSELQSPCNIACRLLLENKSTNVVIALTSRSHDQQSALHSLITRS